MTTEQKFHAAVNVIRGLPKSGSYQPSHDLMLRFYSYFKQATEGKCSKGKPGFWDVVSRAKWDAWNKLGDMSRERAMESYIAELHKIVETMSYTDSVAAFFDAVETQAPVIKDDLLLVAGDVLNKHPSQPPSPTPNGSSPLRNEPGLYNGHSADSEDEYIDTVDVCIDYSRQADGCESEESDIPVRHVAANTVIANGHATLPASEHSSYGSAKAIDTNNTRVLDELRRTVSCLEKDVALLKERVSCFETERNRLERSLMWRRPSWWPLKDVSPALLAAIVVWPMVANRLVSVLKRRKIN